MGDELTAERVKELHGPAQPGCIADVARARREGCHTVLIKPFVGDDLITEIRRALDSTGKNRR
jgi:DNA-binding NtrC family response regulator